MKSKIIITGTGGMAICAFSPAWAIEPPADNAPPPPALVEKAAPMPQRAAAKNNSPYIGIATAEVPEMLANHLNLELGTGVVVRTICPDSPASKAGIAIHDVILKLGGTPVPNPEALPGILAKHQPGDTLSVEIIHQGKPASLDMTIGVRPDDAVAELNADPMLDGLPRDQAQRIRDLIEQNLNAFGNQPLLNEQFRELRQQMDQAFLDDAEVPEAAPRPGIQIRQAATIRMMDNEGSVEIKSSGENTEITVRDLDNQITWTGPWDTPQDKAAAPDQIRERINRVDIARPNFKNGGLRLRFGNRNKADNLPDQ